MAPVQTCPSRPDTDPRVIYTATMPDWGFWIVIAVVALVVEATTTSFFTIYFGIAAAICAVLAALGVPVAGQVLAFRLFRRRILLMAPVHHHFELMAWSETKIMLRFWIIAAVCSGIGYTLYQQSIG